MNKFTYLWNLLKTYFVHPRHLQYKKSKTLSDLPRSRKRWTVEELSDLMQMYEHGLPITTIADELDRPEAGVRSKLISLGYSTKQ